MHIVYGHYIEEPQFDSQLKVGWLPLQQDLNTDREPINMCIFAQIYCVYYKSPEPCLTVYADCPSSPRTQAVPQWHPEVSSLVQYCLQSLPLSSDSTTHLNSYSEV
ncbi:hypothetical protein NL108_001667 [Boleophthalmus pectinirostris]|nr:hypothetical protein NL108_001667 [Boleophthalmus pectinirostris]